MNLNRLKPIILMAFISLIFCSCSERKIDSESINTSISYDRDTEFNYLSDTVKNYNIINESDSELNIFDYRDFHSFANELNSENSDFFIAFCKDKSAIVNESYYVNDNSLNYRLSLSVKSDLSNVEIKDLFLNSQSLDAAKEAICNALSNNVAEGYSIISSLDMDEENIYVFFNVYDNDFDLQDYLCLTVGHDGTISDVFSFSEFIDLHESEHDGQNHNHEHDHDHEDHDYSLTYSAVLDDKGNFVLWNNFSNEFLYIDKDLKNSKSNIIEDCEDSLFGMIGKTRDGVPAFEYSDVNGNLTIFLVSEDIKKITSGRIDFADSRFFEKNGLIYSLSGNSLYCWDVINGICQKIYSFDNLNYCYCKGIRIDDSGNLKIMFYDSYEAGLFEYVLSDKESIEQTDFNIYIYNYDDYLVDCASDFSRKNPSLKVNIKTINDIDTPVNILAKEMKEGNGPDILVINRKMLSALQHSGLVKELDDVVSEDIKNNLFKGVMEYGLIDGNLYGMAYAAHVYTLAGIKGLASKSDWNINTFMSAFNNLKASDPSIKLMAVPNYNMTPEELLLILGTVGLNNSPFIDAEAMTCSFDSDEFIDFLTFLKENGEPEGASELSEEEVYKMLADKKAMLTIVEGGLVSFSQKMSAMYKYCDIYGLPMSKATDIVTEYYCLAANSFSDKDDLIKEFINLALSKECQIKYSTDYARKDILEEHVYEHTDIIEEPLILIFGHNIVPLAAKEDNTSFLNEFMDLMDSGIPATIEYEIQSIILEESSAFFKGTKSAEDVANIIQSRVQLYLEERR